jgi:guanylate kinase
MSQTNDFPNFQPNPLLIVISGVSGAGKDSVVKELQRRGRDFHFVVTATDRRRRPGEVDGRDYIFLTTAEFEALIARDELLEYARVYDQYKGVPKSQVRQALDSGKDVIMRVDVQGAATIRQKCCGGFRAGAPNRWNICVYG